MYTFSGLVFSVLLLGTFVGQSSSFPKKRDVKEVSVGEKSHVDGDDGEIWYPVEGGGADEGEPPPPNYAHTNLANELLEAVRNIFFKWGYTLDEIPAPFGSLDPSRPFHSTPEFTNVLELLVEKLPNEFEVPILNILRENGVREINIPKGILDNSEEIRKIDEIITKIESFSGQTPSSELAVEEQIKGIKEPEDVSEKHDDSRDATIYCETEFGACTSNEEALGSAKGPSLTMKHPDLKIPHEKLFVPRAETPAEDKAELNDDKTKLATLIEEVKENVVAAESAPLENRNSSKVNEELSQISEIVANVESIAERNIKLVGESPCSSALSPERNLEQLDSLLGEIETRQAGRFKQPQENINLDEINALIRQIEADKTSSLASQGSQSLQQGENIKRINEMIRENENARQAHKYSNEKYENGEDVKAIDALMTKIRNHESNQHIQNYGNEGRKDEHLKAMENELAAIRIQQIQPIIQDLQKSGMRDKDLKAIDDQIAAIRNYQMQPLTQDLQSSRKRYENLKTIEAEIGAIRSHQMQPRVQDLQTSEKRNKDLKTMESEIASIRNKQLEPLIRNLENSGRRDEDLKAIDAKISEIRKHQIQPLSQDFENDEKRGGNLKSMDALIRGLQGSELDQLIKSIEKEKGQNDNKEQQKTMDSLMAGIKKHQLASLITPPSPNGNEANQMNSLVREIQAHASSPVETFNAVNSKSNLEDLETTMNEIRTHQVQGQLQESSHIPRHGSRADELQKLNALMNDIERVGSAEAVQTHVEHTPNLHEVDAVIDEMNAKYGVKKSPTEKQERPRSELQMLDGIVKEIGQIARQEEKHIEDSSRVDNRHEVENIVSQIQHLKSPGSDNRLTKLNQIMDNLERESTIERDLQQALDNVKQSETSRRDESIAQIDQLTSQLKNIENSRSQSSASSFQTPEEGKEIDKLVNQIQRLGQDNHAKELVAKVREVANQAKVNSIVQAMQGFPQLPDHHSRQTKEEVARMTDGIKSAKALSEIEAVKDQMKQIPNYFPSGNRLGQRRFNSEKYNSADAQYLRRLKDKHLRRK